MRLARVYVGNKLRDKERRAALLGSLKEEFPKAKEAELVRILTRRYRDSAIETLTKDAKANLNKLAKLNETTDDLDALVGKKAA